jgi:hypothetical protein
MSLALTPLDPVSPLIYFRANQEEIKMAFGHGGARPGAGRKPGQFNRRTIETMERLAPTGERALAVLVSAMEDRSVPWSCRIQAAGMIADRAYGRAPTSINDQLPNKVAHERNRVTAGVTPRGNACAFPAGGGAV